MRLLKVINYGSEDEFYLTIMSEFEIITTSNIDQYKQVLSKIDNFKLISMHDSFKSLYMRKNLKESIIENIFTNLFKVRIGNLDYSYFFQNLTIRDPNDISPLYRVRKLNLEEINSLIDSINSGYTVHPSFLSSESAFWSKPSELVNEWSRLNAPKQSYLYLTNRIEIALNETGTQEGDYFMLMEYRFKPERFKIYQIHDFNFSTLFSESEQLKLFIIQKLLYDTFSKEVKKNETQYYMIPAVLYNKFIKNKDFDIFCYPPVSSKIPGFNIGIEGKKAKNILNFCGASIFLHLDKTIENDHNLKKLMDLDLIDSNVVIKPPLNGDCYDNLK